MKDNNEISKAEDGLLEDIANERLSHYHLLKKIYDVDFIADLIKNKRDPDNLLLFWIVNDNEFDYPTSKVLLKEIEEMLQPFVNSKNFESLKPKLRQWHSIPFESTLTELEFAYEYYKRGFKIELEPDLSNSRKSDFYAIDGELKIFFEIKLAYKEASRNNQALVNVISDCCQKTKHPFYIENIDVGETVKPSDLREITKFIREKLTQLKNSSNILPCTIYYPNKENSQIKIDIKERLIDGQGFVAMWTYGGGITNKWTDLRRKIESGVSQLHPDYPGVVVFRPYGLDYLEYDIKNALYGDLSINFGRNQAETRWFRTGDRIFSPNSNNRLSAVIIYDKRLQNYGFSRKKTVYHNPFAKNKLPKELFDGDNVTQHIDPC
ncbi:MAG: hypothetical protein QW279_15740 [Candidatus Jordarchaeaceae archaeon]